MLFVVLLLEAEGKLDEEIKREAQQGQEGHNGREVPEGFRRRHGHVVSVRGECVGGTAMREGVRKDAGDTSCLAE